jgi:uncharacterized protein
MPANLTPDYDRADAKYRAAVSDDDRLTALREMFAVIPKHKGTEKLQADLKHRISLLRKSIAKAPDKGGPDPFYIPRSGAGQVVLVGPPNVGKSLLVGSTTHAPVKVADYPFTTALPVPGMAHWEDIHFELVDTPPVTADHVPPGLMGTIRSGDIAALIVDASTDPLEQADMLLGLMAARGLQLRSVPRDQLDPANQHDHSALLIANKADLAPADAIAALRELFADRIEVHPVSASTGMGVERFLARCWQMLASIRVYTKEPGQPPDHGKPFVLDVGAVVDDLAATIHRDLPARMKFARLWRDGLPAGQQVHRTELLHDKDIVEIHQ